MRPDRARPDHESFKHVAVSYDSNAAFLRLTVPRVRAALAHDRRVIVATSADKLRLLDEALGDEARQIDRRDSRTWYIHPPRTLAAYHEYTRGRRTLVIGEIPWPERGERETREWIRYESVLNAALEDAKAVALCLYNPRTTPAAVLEYQPAIHPLLLDATGEAVSTGFVRPHELVLNGDLEPLPAPSGRVATVSFTAREIKGLRHTVRDYASAAGMDVNLIGSLVLSVSEIAANSVEHGAGHGMIKMWVSGGEMICEIADPGGALDDPLPGYIPPEPESPRGYGLWISRQLCDYVDLRAENGTLRVRLHMGLDG
ncbi:sensor histidine kinase [Nonomuraea sp. NPDC048901]|uniref:sensor histidine kinase n=1 Tax=Nonomuraea sp. NPDC048901 TaxID=3155627 RepID=UPI0033D39CA7